MISIIICTRQEELSDTLVNNIKATIGVAFEIIAIDNSENKYSLCSAYNEGYTQSNYPYLCFLHDDVIFHTSDWGKLLIAHLQDQQTGIVGLAGGDLITRIPASWSRGFVNTNIIQSDKSGKKSTKSIQLPSEYPLTKRSTVVLDGVMLAMRGELMGKVHFDERLEGFHGYDFDITIQSNVAGFTNYVLYDINLEHLSRGKPDKNYYKNLIQVYKKWEQHLPILGASITEETRLKIPTIEKERLRTLINRMIKTGFTAREVLLQLNYYTQLSGQKKTLFQSSYIYIHAYLVQLLAAPNYFSKK